MASKNIPMSNYSKHVDILDTTLRDGSYTIGYQFTADETALIVQGLEFSGVGLIEVGHGLGLGADRAGKGAQAVTDVAYMRACTNMIRKSKFGFFFIPGVGEKSDLELLAAEGGAFVRVGVALENVDQAYRAIETARSLGLEVWANIMKTYAYPLEQCNQAALAFVRAGAEGVYVVDSAGGMLPAEVSAYVSGLRETFRSAGVDARIGFHGHDNLSLSTACSLAAVEAGGNIVDGSLLGIGRSIGNAATEVLAMVLERGGYETGVNAWHAADLAEKTIRPFLEQRWRHSSLEQALGHSRVHSGFLPLIEKIARQEKLNVRDVVLALGPDACRTISESDVLAATSLVKNQATQLKRKSVGSRNSLSGQESLLPIEQVGQPDPDLAGYAAEIRSQSLRMARPAGVVIAGPWRENVSKKIKTQQIRLLDQAVVGAIEVPSAADMEYVATMIDGVVDLLFLDKTPRTKEWNETLHRLENRQWQSRVLPYADEVSGLVGACHIVAIEAGKRGVREIAILGTNARSQMMNLLFPYWGMAVVEADRASVIVIAERVEDDQKLMHPNLKLIYDLMSGTLHAELVEKLLDNGAEVIRLDGRAALVGEVAGLLDAQHMVDCIMGRGKLNSVSVVAGGVWGRKGEVVVNSIQGPTEVLGIADGSGSITSVPCAADMHLIDQIKTTLRENFLESVFGAGLDV